MLDRPVAGRIFFEQVIRENLDIGRPGQVQLIFDRRVARRTPGRFRTRVITEGVTPSLHVDYKRSRIKQYHKEGQALRSETTINDTRDFGVGRLLKNLPALRRIGFAANRRLLEIEQISHDCALGDDAFQHLQRPRQIDGQRAPALRFGDANAQALLNAVLMFVFVAHGFTNKDLRQTFGVLLGRRPQDITPGRMSYELRRLRLHGLIQRLPRTCPGPIAIDSPMRDCERRCSIPACTHASCARPWHRSCLPPRPIRRLHCAPSMLPKQPSIHGATRPTSQRRKLDSINTNSSQSRNLAGGVPIYQNSSRSHDSLTATPR